MLLSVVFFVLTYNGIAPIMSADSVTPLIAYTLSGVGVVQVAVALVFFKPGVPARRLEQSVEEYWSTPRSVRKSFWSGSSWKVPV